MKKVISILMALCMVIGLNAVAADKVNPDLDWVYEAFSVKDPVPGEHGIYSIPAFNINTADAQKLNDEFVEFYDELDKGWNYNSSFKEYRFEDYLSVVVISKGVNDHDAYCAKTINVVTGEAIRNSDLLAMTGFTDETFLEYLYGVLKEHSDKTLKKVGNDPYGSYKKMYASSLTDEYCNLDIPMYISNEGHLIIAPQLMNSAGIYIQAVDTGYLIDSNSEITEQEEQVSVYINGDELEFDQPPVIIDDRTLVPLRAIFEALGATVEWSDENKTVTAAKGNTSVKIAIGDNKLYVNDDIVELDVPAQIINERTLVPVRAISEAFGSTVEWDGDSRTVNIK